MDTTSNPAKIPMPAYQPQTNDEIAVYNLYKQLLKSWNEQDADNYGALFTEDASVIGFDGSTMNGSYEITEALRAVFSNHRTNNYVSKLRGITWLQSEVALVNAVAGMHPPGSPEIKADVNAIQSLVAVKKAGKWRIALFQNTPAQFHGRPELSAALTHELQELVK